MTERCRRRWILLLFGTVVSGAAARNAVELARALDCYHAQRYSEARTLFGRLAQYGMPDPEIDFYLGRLALWFDDEAEALARLEAAARAAPRDARIRNALGDAYGLAAQNAPLITKLGWANKCRAAYQEAIALDPANPAYRWSLLGYLCVAPRLAGGGLDKAQVQAEAIALLDPSAGRVARATLALAEHRFAEAFSQFESILAEDPDDFLALYHVGRCAALSGREIDRGLASLRRCLDLRVPAGDGMPTIACVHYRIGNLLEKKGDAAGARREYEAARSLHPDFRPQKILPRN